LSSPLLSRTGSGAVSACLGLPVTLRVCAGVHLSHEHREALSAFCVVTRMSLPLSVGVYSWAPSNAAARICRNVPDGRVSMGSAHV
jgi:hypothetical protein